VRGHRRCGSPIAPRGSTRRWCTRRQRSWRSAGSLPGASVHESIVIAIAVLIITPHARSRLLFPAVQVVAAGTLFGSGVILNGGDVIERLAKADTIVFDKTER
jgi:cation transport ATPase